MQSSGLEDLRGPRAATYPCPHESITMTESSTRIRSASTNSRLATSGVSCCAPVYHSGSNSEIGAGLFYACGGMPSVQLSPTTSRRFPQCHADTNVPARGCYVVIVIPGYPRRRVPPSVLKSPGCVCHGFSSVKLTTPPLYC